MRDRIESPRYKKVGQQRVVYDDSTIRLEDVTSRSFPSNTTPY